MKTKLLLLVIWMISLQSFAQNTYSTISVGYLQNPPQNQLNPQDWHYVAVTKSGLNGNIYIDGVLVSSSTYSNVPYIWNSLLLGATQGCVSCSPVPTYLGLIDEVRISNTVRTATEIQNNFNGNSPFASDANTLGLFHFDTNTGTSITNSTGGNNGVLYGGVAFGTGKFGLGLSFDGVDDYSRIIQSIPVNNMTIEFWYKSSDNEAVLAMMEYAYNTGIYLNTTSISCQVPTGTLADGMVAYYPFCGNANDGSTNANNGTVNGATLTADRYGNLNSAYSFNGSSNFIQVPNSTSLQNINEITISAWIDINAWYQSGGNGYFPILHKSDQQGQYGKYALTIKDNGGISHLGSQENGFSFPSWNLSNWQHVVLVISNNTNKIYVDGNMVSDAPSGVFPNSFSETLPLIIGMDKPGLIEYANGKIDDIGIWNRALSQQEITNLYNNNLSTNSFENTETLITIYPNPAKDHITIDCGNLVNVNGWIIKINNTLGQEIYHSKLNEKVEKISLGSIAKSGLYIIHITDRNGKTISTKKVLLQ
jgi:hypothetical protein